VLLYRLGDLDDVDLFEVFVDIDGTRAEGVVLLSAADALRPRFLADLPRLSQRRRPRARFAKGLVRLEGSVTDATFP
jgi:hypothetical protein